MGWMVEGTVLMPETSVSTESVGKMPCNALSVPQEAAVIAKMCGCAGLHRVEGRCPRCGLGDWKGLHDTDFATAAGD
jgi:hypothetical protein